MSTTPATLTDELLLIDLSSIAHPIWHMSQSEPDPNATCTKVVDRVRALSSQHPHAAICCDTGKSFRHDVDPSYKSQRPPAEAALHHQIRLSREQLARDGFPVWSVKGFEADDLIASATVQALAIPETTVLIASADKDLLQLVNHRVKAKSMRDGSIVDEEAVKARYGVMPAQMRDYLSLVGDTSDNVVGAKGIGPKKAAELLNLFGSLDDLYAAIDNATGVFSAAIRASLVEFRERLPRVRELIALRTDVEIPFAEIAAERAPKDAAPMEELMPEDVIDIPQRQQTVAVEAPVDAVTVVGGAPRLPQSDAAASVPNAGGSGVSSSTAMTVQADPAPAEWEKQLEPRSLGQAGKLAEYMHKARLFNGYGSPEAVLSTIMAGRELGMQAIASLRGFHIVEGRHMLAADLIRGLVLRSGLANYFRCTERTATKATFSTQRKGDPEPVSLTYTIEEGRIAFGIVPELPEKDRAAKEASWLKSGWGRNPADMLVARAGAKLARLVYPEVTFGLYSPEEFDNGGH
jgi:5'-3' exonuclease